MDKNEYRVKLDQINDLVDRRDYKQALDIVNTIDWRRVRSARTLCMVAEIYEANQRYEESRKLLMMAHHRAPLGKTVLYRLVELAVKTENFAEAREYYDQFVEVSPNDNSRYILQYKIYRGEKASLQEQIEILEAYKERENTERWSYELARLYAKAGMKDKCVTACDDIILWFSEGKYVTKAMELKMRYAALTPSQKIKYDNRDKGFPQESTMAATAASIEAATQAASRIVSEPKHDIDIPKSTPKLHTKTKFTDEPSVFSPILETTGVLQEKIVKGIKDVFSGGAAVLERLTEEADMDSDDKFEEDTEDYVVKDLEPDTLSSENSIKPAAMKTEYMELEDDDENEEDKFNIKSRKKETSTEAFLNSILKETRKVELRDKVEEEIKEVVKEEIEETEKAEETEEVKEEQKEEQKEETPGVIPELNLEELFAETAGGLAQAVAQVSDGVLNEGETSFKKAENYVMPEIKEEKEVEKPVEESAEEPVVNELEKTQEIILERPVVKEVVEEVIEEPVEELVEEVAEEETTEEPAEEVEETVEEVVEEPVEEPVEEVAEEETTEEPAEEVVEEVIEEPVEEVVEEETTEEPAEEVVEEVIEEPVEEPVKEVAEEETTEEPAEEVEETIEEATEEPVEEAVEEVIEEPVEEPVEEVAEEQKEKEALYPNLEEVLAEATAAVIQNMEKEAEDDMVVYKKVEDMEELPVEEAKTIQMPVEEIKDKYERVQIDLSKVEEAEDLLHRHNLTPEEHRRLFTYFAPVPGVSQQIKDALDAVQEFACDRTSRSGNVVITGRGGTGKTRLCEGVIKAICKERHMEGARIAYVESVHMNKKDPASVVNKVAGGFLVIENASGMSQDTIEKLSKSMEFKTERLTVILEDLKTGIKKLEAAYPEFMKKFNAKITIPVFTNDELVSFAKTYSKELGYKIDDMAVLALYTLIGDNQDDKDPVSVGQVKDMVDAAIQHASKGGRRHGKKVAKRHLDESGRIMLYEKDFDA